MTPRARWMVRNRGWLIALIPLLVGALAVTGWRLLRIYPVIEFVAPQGHGSQVEFHQRVPVSKGSPIERVVTIGARGSAPVDAVGSLRPDPGAQLHLVTLSFAARPDVPLVGCEVFLVDAAGSRYSALRPPIGGLTDTASTRLDRDCVPEDAPGPAVDWINGGLEPGEGVRPDSWTTSMAFELPQGTQPTRVIVRWINQAPDYALLEIPR